MAGGRWSSGIARSPQQVAVALAERARARCGPDELARVTRVPARTISGLLRLTQVPYRWQCDPLTGDVIRASKVTARRYEHAHPGDLVHVDVKKTGRIPEHPPVTNVMAEYRLAVARSPTRTDHVDPVEPAVSCANHHTMRSPCDVERRGATG